MRAETDRRRCRRESTAGGPDRIRSFRIGTAPCEPQILHDFVKIWTALRNDLLYNGGKMKTTSFIVIALLVSAAAIAADIRGWPEDDVMFDVVGQVKNAGTQSIQYGYLSYINGLAVEQTFAPGSSQDEKTAYFTFYNDGTTIRTVTHGLWRIVTREGTSTIYYNVAPHGDLTTPTPDSFRSGTPIATST